jgi:dihydroorotate dehydrogenase
MSLGELDFSELTENEKPHWLWRLCRKVAFSFDAEAMHELAIALLSFKSQWGPNNIPKIAHDANCGVDKLGLRFPNLVGLAAGFDIDGRCIPALGALGFGFIEVGGITHEAQEGSPRPRIFRLPQDKALINRVNFHNYGAENLRKNLLYWREKNLAKVPIGINLGKSCLSNLEQVPEAYARAFKYIWDVADYVTINISCSTESLASFQTAKSLGMLLDAVCNINEKLVRKVPLLLKLGPDLSNEEAVACAEIALDYRLAGLIISNATVKRNGLVDAREFGAGGLSGQPLFERSTQLLRCVAKDYGGRLTLVGSGGIMDGAAALAKLNAGADLLQVYSGLIYGGPAFVINLLNYLQLHYFAA